MNRSKSVERSKQRVRLYHGQGQLPRNAQIGATSRVEPRRRTQTCDTIIREKGWEIAMKTVSRRQMLELCISRGLLVGATASSHSQLLAAWQQAEATAN